MEFPPENIKDRIIKFIARDNIRDSIIVKISIGILIIFLGVLMFPHPEDIEYRYNVGNVWVDKDLIAPFAFPIYKDLRQYEHERQAAIRTVFPVFEWKKNINQSCIDSLKSTVRLLSQSANGFIRWSKSRTQTDSLTYVDLSRALPFAVSTNEWNFLARLQDSKKKSVSAVTQEFEQLLVLALNDVLQKGIIDRVKSKQLHSTIAARQRITEDLLRYEEIYDVDEALSVIGTRISSMFETTIEAEIATKICRAVIQPNLLFDQAATNLSIQMAADGVPRTIGFVQSNERIVSKHDPITEEIKLKLDSYRRAKLDIGANANNWKHWLGATLHISIIICLFSLYLSLFRKKLFADNGKLMLIGLLILFEMILAYLSLIIQLQEPLQYLIFVPAASMLFAIIFDSRVAFYGTVTIAFLIGGIRSNDYILTLSAIVAGALGAYTVRDIRNRAQIFLSMIYIFIGYAISIVALSLEQLENITQIFTEISFALANSILSPVLTYALLIFFERVFRVTTDLTLLELSDFNHPLLRELSEKTPGTFHHSVTIGNLAEAAAEAIGANPILARVGGYYHDIGKILKPEYFVENQVGPHSRHSRLRPRMSALIISSHVREGIELGREKGLPEVVIDFIPQHHGTTRISYFFDKALKQATKRPTKDAIREEDFLYPGPKPQTKETGIVMLADSIEAATRTLIELTPQKLEAATENMIKHRFMDGQLDECELTLRDLTKIREAFLKILLGTHHQRIKYPDEHKEEISSAAIKTEQPAEEKSSESTVQETTVKEDIQVQPPMPGTPSNIAASKDQTSDAKQMNNEQTSAQNL